MSTPHATPLWHPLLPPAMVGTDKKTFEAPHAPGAVGSLLGQLHAQDCSPAQALLQAEKVPIVRLALLRCAVPYALEGLLRRELDAAGASLLSVTHGEAVELCFSLPEDAAAALHARLGEAGQGRIMWLPPTETAD